jgi:hypothetical protein
MYVKCYLFICSRRKCTSFIRVPVRTQRHSSSYSLFLSILIERLFVAVMSYLCKSYLFFLSSKLVNSLGCSPLPIVCLSTEWEEIAVGMHNNKYLLFYLCKMFTVSDLPPTWSSSTSTISNGSSSFFFYFGVGATAVIVCTTREEVRGG